MSTTTSRLALVQPAGGDAPAVLRTSIGANATTLDNAALFTQGTLVGRPAAGTFGRWYLATDDTSSGSPIGTAWFDNGSTWTSAWNPPSRGAVSIVATESRTNVGYGTLTTADQVTGIVLPTNGLISVWYQATWQESVAGAARAAIFVGANQLKVQAAVGAPGPNTQAAATHSLGPNYLLPLVTCPVGLASLGTPVSGAPVSADVSTGQVVGAAVAGSSTYPSITEIAYELGGTALSVENSSGGLSSFVGGPCSVFAAAGTYTISVQFKASSGSVTASNRKLWVQAVPFS